MDKGDNGQGGTWTRIIWTKKIKKDAQGGIWKKQVNTRLYMEKGYTWRLYMEHKDIDGKYKSRRDVQLIGKASQTKMDKKPRTEVTVSYTHLTLPTNREV